MTAKHLRQVALAHTAVGRALRGVARGTASRVFVATPARSMLVLLLPLAACAGTQAPRTPPWESASYRDAQPAHWLLLNSLTHQTADQMRAELAADFREPEVQRVGFDQVTIAACIDGVVAAMLHARQFPDDARATTALDDAIDDYLASAREARMRRCAGAASCLPGR